MSRLSSDSERGSCHILIIVGTLIMTVMPMSQACAYYAFTVDSGYGMEDTRLLRLNLSVGDGTRYPTNNGWYWSLNWEGNISYWYLYKQKRGEDRLVEAGITPNFRLAREHKWGWARPYLEMGLGVHFLSERYISNRDLGSYFQFGTHGGLGIRFGSTEQYDLAWRIEHISNAGLREPNPGINFSMVRFGYRW